MSARGNVYLRYKCHGKLAISQPPPSIPLKQCIFNNLKQQWESLLLFSCLVCSEHLSKLGTGQKRFDFAHKTESKKCYTCIVASLVLPQY